MSSWYTNSMPKVKDVKSTLVPLVEAFKKAAGLKGVYAWGSYARNINNPGYRVKDLDILVKTGFHSGDLISIDADIISTKYSDSQLAEMGYDPQAIHFSKEFTKISGFIDCWVISSDRKLVHWGPVASSCKESLSIDKEAEEYADNNSSTSIKKINLASEQNRSNWYRHYSQYMNKYFEGNPTGWYKTESVKLREINKKIVKL